MLWDVDLRATRGQLTKIGPNGAGKARCCGPSWAWCPLQGDISVDGHSRVGTSTWDMAREGAVMTPKGRMIFRDMSVEENLLIGAFHKRHHRAAAPDDLARMYWLYSVPAGTPPQMAGSLSGGESQMLTIGRGLMSDPRLILVDEPSLGLAPVMVQEIFATLARLRAEGRTIIPVEQNTSMADGIADHVCLMRGGKVSQPAAGVDLQRLNDLYFSR